MSLQNVMWLASNIETDSLHRLVTDEQIEKWNAASTHGKLKIKLPTQFDYEIYDTSADKTIIVTLDEYIGAAPGTLANTGFTSLDEYKYPGDYIITDPSKYTNLPDENITNASLTVKMIGCGTIPKYMQILYDTSDESRLSIYIRYSTGFDAGASISVHWKSINLIANQNILTNWHQMNHIYISPESYEKLQWSTEWRKIQLV